MGQYIDSATKKYLLHQLLSRPENKYCADCYAQSPTWASLNIGIFVCMRCAGSHRALGPTVTRIKSVELDEWKQEWFTLMQLGNTIINQYWEHSLNPQERLDRNATNPVRDRYADKKYVKKKFAPPGQVDPLTLSLRKTNDSAQNPQNTKLGAVAKPGPKSTELSSKLKMMQLMPRNKPTIKPQPPKPVSSPPAVVESLPFQFFQQNHSAPNPVPAPPLSKKAIELDLLSFDDASPATFHKFQPLKAPTFESLFASSRLVIEPSMHFTPLFQSSLFFQPAFPPTVHQMIPPFHYHTVPLEPFARVADQVDENSWMV